MYIFVVCIYIYICMYVFIYVYVLLYTCMYLYIDIWICIYLYIAYITTLGFFSDFQLLHPDTVGPKVSYTPRGDAKCTADGTGRDPSLSSFGVRLVGCRVGSQKIPTKTMGLEL